MVKEFGVKTSTEDPLPAKFLNLVIDEALPCLTILINQSLKEGSIEGIKLSVLDPLLKKAGLDVDTKKNYRPVNNLVFISKLIERVVRDRSIFMGIRDREICNGTSNYFCPQQDRANDHFEG